MSAPPEVRLEAEDNKEFLEQLRALAQMKRLLLLKIGKPGTSLEEMQVAKTLLGMLGETPSDARRKMVQAQGHVNSEELVQAVHGLEAKSFEAVSMLEGFAAKVEVNTEESVDAKRKEILKGVEDYRDRVLQAIDKLERLTSFTPEGGERLSSSQGSQPRGEPENKFTPHATEAPEKLPPRAECNPKSYSDWWKDTILYLNACYSRPPSDRDYVKKIWLMLDSSWRDILRADQYKCTLEELHNEIEKEILRSYPMYRRRCSFFSIPQKSPQKASETPGQVLNRVRLEAAVSGVGEERSVNCPTCTCAQKCVVVGEQDMTYQGSVTAVWLASLRQDVQQKVFEQFAHKPMATDKELQDFSTILDNLALAFKSKGSVNAVHPARGRKQAGGQGDKKRAASEGGKAPRAATGEKGTRSGETCDFCRKTLNKEAFHPTKFCWRDPKGAWWRPNLTKKVSTVTPDSEKAGGTVNSLSMAPRRVEIGRAHV